MSEAPETISEAIEQSALGPLRVTIDGQTVERHPLADQIAADKYTKAVAQTASGRTPIRRFKLIPKGST